MSSNLYKVFFYSVGALLLHASFLTASESNSSGDDNQLSLSKSSSNDSMSEEDSLSYSFIGLRNRDHFNEQQQTHYKELLEEFNELACKEFYIITCSIINCIKNNNRYFLEHYEGYISIVKDIIISHVENNLTENEFQEYQQEKLDREMDVQNCKEEERNRAGEDTEEEDFEASEESSSASMSDEEAEEDEEASSTSMAEGEAEEDEQASSALMLDEEAEEDEEVSSTSMAEGEAGANILIPMGGNQELGSDEEFGSEAEATENLKQYERDYKKWQGRSLESLLGLEVSSMDDFGEDIFDSEHVSNFLGNVEDGHSWLTNDIIENTLKVSKDFIEEFSSQINAPQEILEAIVGGICGYHNWERENMEDKGCIARTYINTLEAFANGEIGQHLKYDIEETLGNLFLYNPEDFLKFDKLKQKYNEYAKKRDWKNALITWSVYSMYRKAFEEAGILEELEELSESESRLEEISKFNRGNALLERLDAALLRANIYYTKVYPHADTRFLIYQSRKRECYAELRLDQALSQLRRVGEYLETFRPKGKENILVPMLYFVVRAPYPTAGEFTRTFVPIPLDLELPHGRPLTVNPEDKVFTAIEYNFKDRDCDYFKKAGNYYLQGCEILGVDEDKAKEKFLKTLREPISRSTQLIHSERVLIEVLNREESIEKIISLLGTKLRELYPDLNQPEYKISASVLLSYSTNSVCEFCTPSLLALQNSYEKGFLYLLTRLLNQPREGISFRTKGYDRESVKQDFSKFGLDIFITAKTDFQTDPQSHDLADEGQHAGKAPKTHNPQAKLFFHNQIDVNHYPPLEEETSEGEEEEASEGEEEEASEEEIQDPYKKYFYEFVGKTLHSAPSPTPLTDENGDIAFPGICFSSGSTVYNQLKKSS
ncbi:MAG: hypothetical protein K0M45_05260 [Candidatus Paracaedibacteraceae bacterium]|nr:hypothetical protein [Candidatus Paracaedibacteraceae bacterium]